MSEAPEKIWRWDVYAWDHIIEYSEFPVISENSVEYTRSDIAQARIEKLEEALRFYATPHAIPNDGPWGVESDDYGHIACMALGETT
jgi:hypothetical protein